MNTNKKSAGVLEDVKIDVKIKLSALWATVMLCYAYGDILGFMKPGAIEHYMNGIGATGSPMTQATLLGIAVFMAIPSVMVFLSLTLRPKVNRRANIILGIVYTCAVPPTLLVPGTSAYYWFLTIVEVVLAALIFWHAWKWPQQEG